MRAKSKSKICEGAAPPRRSRLSFRGLRPNGTQLDQLQHLSPVGIEDHAPRTGSAQHALRLSLAAHLVWQLA